MDGRPKIHKNMGTPANICTKKHESVLCAINAPGHAKRKKWNNYTTKAKTTHHNPNKCEYDHI
jgi:hypothetical protein